MKSQEDKIIRNNIKNILIECRVKRDLTQTEVGKIVGKSKNAVASWEQGLSLPDIVTLLRLAKYYNVPIDYMFGEGVDPKEMAKFINPNTGTHFVKVTERKKEA